VEGEASEEEEAVTVCAARGHQIGFRRRAGPGSTGVCWVTSDQGLTWFVVFKEEEHSFGATVRPT
jgi:hypothetical protein